MAEEAGGRARGGLVSWSAMLLLLVVVAVACAKATPTTDGRPADLQTLLTNLRAGGDAVAPKGTKQVKESFFSAPGTPLTVNGALVTVFEYGDVKTAAAEAATISGGGSIVGNASIDWVDEPHFFTAGRVIALYVGRDGGVLKALERVLGPSIAGPDQPVSSPPIPAEPVPGGGVLPTPKPVTPRPGMAGVYPIRWEQADVALDDRTLTVQFTTGVEPCYVLDHVDVQTTRTTVTVTLYQGHDPGSKGVACIDIGIFASVTVVLDQPLAGRKIVDGSAAAKS
jgi:hypothetical protein